MSRRRQTYHRLSKVSQPIPQATLLSLSLSLFLSPPHPPQRRKDRRRTHHSKESPLITRNPVPNPHLAPPRPPHPLVQQIIQGRHNMPVTLPARAPVVIRRQLQERRAAGRACRGGGRRRDVLPRGRLRGRARGRGLVGLAVRCRGGCWGGRRGAGEGRLGLFHGGLIALEVLLRELERHCGGLAPARGREGTDWGGGVCVSNGAERRYGGCQRGGVSSRYRQIAGGATG